MSIVKQRQVSDIIHEFADIIQSNHDAIIVTDPGYANLSKMLTAMQIYAERIGGDLGVRYGGVVAVKGIKTKGKRF